MRRRRRVTRNPWTRNRFTLRSSRGNLKVSWQVTGIRKDAWAEKNRIPNTVDKIGAEKGRYLHPDAFGKPASMGTPAIPEPARAKHEQSFSGGPSHQ